MDHGSNRVASKGLVNSSDESLIRRTTSVSGSLPHSIHLFPVSRNDTAELFCVDHTPYSRTNLLRHLCIRTDDCQVTAKTSKSLGSCASKTFPMLLSSTCSAPSKHESNTPSVLGPRLQDFSLTPLPHEMEVKDQLSVFVALISASPSPTSLLSLLCPVLLL